MNVVCCICHENVRVPVRFLCFPCKNEPGQPSCNSITRVCLACAHAYLQLDTDRSDRAYSRKCLTCPAMVRCAPLSPTTSYEKDFFMMSHDTKDDYHCFYHEQGCGFQGTQNGLDQHLQTQCPFRAVSCRYCRTHFQAQESAAHVLTCPQHFHCSACSQYVPLQDKRDHFLEQHHQRQCAYCQCYISTHTYDGHLCECPERPQECAHCHQTVSRQAMYSHLMTHIHSCENEIQQHANAIRALCSQISALAQQSQKYR